MSEDYDEEEYVGEDPSEDGDEDLDEEGMTPEEQAFTKGYEEAGGQEDNSEEDPEED
jgi:hypothetical protein